MKKRMHLSTESSQPDEAWRIERLADVRTIIGASTINTPINGIHDNKGILYVSWRAQPTTTERELMGMVWVLVGEINVHVEHSVMTPITVL